MRVLVIFLLTLNLFFFLWALTLGNKTYTPPPRTESGIPPIQLIIENNHLTKNTEKQSKCYSLGPFNSERTARTVARMISDYGLATTIKKQKTRQTLDFLVYLQALPSRKEAEKVVADVRKNKIKNPRIIESGPYKNAITLGSFEDLDKARRHAEYVRFLGYDAKYTAQKKQKEVFWINYDEPMRSHAPVMEWVISIDPKAVVQKIQKVCEF